MKPEELAAALPATLDYELLKHNGVAIDDYPERVGWWLVPFPMAKGRPYNADNLATVNRHTFLDDPAFTHLRRISEDRWARAEMYVRDITWRLEVFRWASRTALEMWERGSEKTSVFLECGSGLGYMASALLEIRRTFEERPHVYFADSFLPYSPDVSGEQAHSNELGFAYATSPESILEIIDDDAAHVIEGRIPESLAALDGLRIAFLHLDLNSHVTEERVVEWLIPRLASRYVILLDDYGGPGGSKQALVHERLAEALGKSLLPLPTGQALLIQS